MSSIQVHDKIFVPYLTRSQIETRIAALARQMEQELAGKKPLFIAILNGSFVFAADLFRHLTFEAEISFIKLASYKGTTSTGNLVTSIGLEESLFERHVVIVEDIVDTGKTLFEFLPQVRRQNPASLRVATLLSKPAARKFPVDIAYTGFEIPDKFVLGYGLDYDGLGRNIPEIYQLSE
jgi:hypoxanthine phosphoribosyltransferase